jgi:hypothetical protein
MNKSELEESKKFLNHRYETEKDRETKNYIAQLYSLFEDMEFDNHMQFRGAVDERLSDFRKKNGKYPSCQFDQNKFTNNQVKEINYVPKKQTLEKPVFENNEKIIANGSKSICVIINSFDELIDAMKCVLWSLENEPSTAIKIFQHLLIVKNNKKVSFTQEDYEQYTNDLIREATRTGQLYVQKERINGKTVYFYTNPTKRRMGHFLDGKLRTLRQIEKFYDIPFTTLHSRLKKMSIDQAVKK